MDNTEEVMNQTIALPPTRPMVAVSPRRIMPTVRVLKTNGAMTILINRRNRSVSSVILSARAETVVGVA